ncbi:MAG: hypothetical protein GY906_40735 [bacterium]|nr:hypothetical protein [bacterium]
MPSFSFDIHLLGLKDASAAGRARFCDTMARITGRMPSEFSRLLSEREPRIFESLDKNHASQVVENLTDAGVRVEIRPSTAIPLSAEEQMAHTMNCPNCDFLQPAGGLECPRCGLVYAKWERENIAKMQREKSLEEAVTRSLQIREEWRVKALAYLENNPLPPEKTVPFDESLLQDELPFLALSSEQGPLLLTSRRMLFPIEGQMISMPYELVSDVDFGGGLIQVKGKIRLQFTFHAAVQVGENQASNLQWQLDKESAFYKDVVMDWAFARHFICGACGANELQYRYEGQLPYARCMHCAVDHEIDLVEAVAIPLATE